MVAIGSRSVSARDRRSILPGLRSTTCLASELRRRHSCFTHRMGAELLRKGGGPVWEGTLLLACGVWNLRSLGHLKLLPEADLSAGLLTNPHHLIRVTFALEFHTLWRERKRKD